jgi:hypothetical protein
MTQLNLFAHINDVQQKPVMEVVPENPVSDETKFENWHMCAKCVRGDYVGAVFCGKDEKTDKWECWGNNFKFYEPDIRPVAKEVPRKDYCLVCQKTENVSYYEQEDTHYCEKCAGVYLNQ